MGLACLPLLNCRYEGSLTGPPHTEAVVWTVFEEPIRISRLQMKNFHTLHNASNNGRIDMNFRALQPIEGRFILRSDIFNNREYLDNQIKRLFTLRERLLQFDSGTVWVEAAPWSQGIDTKPSWKLEHLLEEDEKENVVAAGHRQRVNDISTTGKGEARIQHGSKKIFPIRDNSIFFNLPISTPFTSKIGIGEKKKKGFHGARSQKQDVVKELHALVLTAPRLQ